MSAPHRSRLDIATGIPGVPGPAGPAGMPGADGQDGLDGADGFPGLPGATGATGPTGATGAAGSPGAPGAPGSMGPAGLDGLDGEDGAVGPAGPTGATGATGSTGATGATGAIGPMGNPGLDGLDGEDGWPGPQGVAGPIGATGATGSTGAAGAAGAAGAMGAPGLDGADPDDSWPFIPLSIPTMRPEMFDAQLTVWPSIPDIAAGQEVHSLIISPTIALDPAGIAGNTDSSKWWAIEVNPIVTCSASQMEFCAVKCKAVITQTVADVFFEQMNLFSSNMTSVSNTNGISPNLPDTFIDTTLIKQTVGTGASSSASISFISQKQHLATGTATLNLTLTSSAGIVAGDYGLCFKPVLNADVGATVLLDEAAAVLVQDASFAGAGSQTIAAQIGLDVQALTKGTTIAAVRSAIAAGTNRYCLQSTGTAVSVHAGKVRLGDTTVPTNALEVAGDTTIQIDGAGNGTFNASKVAGAHLILNATTSAATPGSVKLWTLATNSPGATAVLDIAPGATIDLANVGSVVALQAGASGVWRCAADGLAGFQGSLLFNVSPIIRASTTNIVRTSNTYQWLRGAPNFQVDNDTGSLPPSFTVDSTRAVAHIPSLTRKTPANAGTVVVIESTAVYDEPTLNTGATITTRRGLWFKDRVTGGTQTTAYAVDMPDQTTASIGTVAAAVHSDLAADAKKFFLKDDGGAQSKLTGKFTTYNAVTTAGFGVPAIVAAGRLTAKTAAQASVATFTVGGADGTFRISANVLITTGTTHNFTTTVAYTDEGNTTRTVTLNFSSLAGALATTIVSVAGNPGAVPYEGVPLHIRCKAATAITIATTGIFTTVTYNVEGLIEQLA